MLFYLAESPIHIIDMGLPANHVDFSQIIPFFPDLEEIHLCYKVRL